MCPVGGGIGQIMTMKKEKTEDIKKAIQKAVKSFGNNSEDAVEAILKSLDDQKVFRYHQDNEVSLMSTPGRVLISIISDPSMTVRAISVYLDLSETMIDKTIKTLIAGGLITKTKSQRQNVYQINKNSVLKQQDIRHFLSAIESIKLKKEIENNENELF